MGRHLMPLYKSERAAGETSFVEMQSGEDMERELQLRHDAARLLRQRKMMEKDSEELLTALQASQKTFESLRLENKELKAQLKGLEWVTEEHQDLLEEKRRMPQALHDTEVLRLKSLALQTKNAEMEEECERMEGELFHASCDLEDVQREKERLRKELSGLERSLVKMRRMAPKDREVETARRDATIAELKFFAENYAEHNRVSEQRVNELQERISAASEWKGPSIAEEIAACEKVNCEKLEEKMEKCEASNVRQSCVLRSVLGFVVKLLLLLFCLVLLVPCCREPADTRGTELLLEAIKTALEPHCSIHFPQPPPF